MRTTALIFCFSLAACGGGGGGHTDSNPGGDTPGGGKTFHITGIATQQAITGSSPAQGVVVAAFKSSDEQNAVTMATTDATGAYMLTVMTDTSTLDGFLKATKSGNVDTYLYPPAPLTMDFMNASVNELDTNLFNFLNGNGQCNNGAGQTLIVLEVFDTANMPVAGVSVTSSPTSARIGYTGAGGQLPDFTATATTADGRAYVCQLPAGAVTLSATKTGVTFKNTMLKTHAGAFTTTVVTE